MTTVRNAVIGTAAGYPIDAVKNFVLSFREYNKTDQLIFIVDLETQGTLREFAAQYSIELVVFSSFRFTETFVNNSRYTAILDYIATVGPSQFKNILLADVRDVMFQSDPFANLPDNFLYFFNEDPGIPLGEQEFNARWIRLPYGEEILEQIKNYPIICSGTVLGSGNMINEYLVLVYQQMLGIRYHKFDLFKTEILDQGITNFLARLLFNTNLIVEVKNSGDIVGTIGLSVSDPRAKDKVTLHMGKVMVNNQVPAILHQYDRSGVLLDFINKKYLTDFSVRSV